MVNSADSLRLDLVVPSAIAERLRAGAVPATERHAAIGLLFRKAGCKPTEQKVQKHSVNVICILPGETAETIVVGGHIDFVQAGQGCNGSH